MNTLSTFPLHKHSWAFGQMFCIKWEMNLEGSGLIFAPSHIMKLNLKPINKMADSLKTVYRVSSKYTNVL